jgi:uncharacterized protein (DUF433 family)/DNA-binding transcriptional MerR regulator
VSTSTRASAHPNLLVIGLYPPAEVSHLLGIPISTVHRWIEGYSYPLARHFRAKKPPVFVPALPRLEGRLTLTFLDLVQLRVVRAFREAGVPLQRIRVAGETAGDLFGTSHPLAHLRFKTEGRSVWSDMANTREREVMNLSAAGQRAFPEVVAESLKEIGYAPEPGLADRWYAAGPGGGVVVDPEIAFGAPVLVGANVPTATVWSQSQSEPDVHRLASWFRLDLRQVQDAIRFEERLSRAA